MWRNIFKSVNLIAGTYDAVIRTRWDVIYPEPLRLDGAKFDTYWIPRGEDHRRGICDILAISSQSNMKYYASLHEKLVQYVDGGVIAHPEILLKHHLLFQSDRISTVTRFDYPLHLIRGTNPRLKLHPANPVLIRFNLKHIASLGPVFHSHWDSIRNVARTVSSRSRCCISMLNHNLYPPNIARQCSCVLAMSYFWQD